MATSLSSRVSLVWLRKSTGEQDHASQRRNVEAALKERGVTVPNENWLEITTSRALVTEEPAYKKLLGRIENDEIDTLYVESRSRLGMTKHLDYFRLLDVCQQHSTKIIDLQKKAELTAGDVGTVISGVLGTEENKDKLLETAQQSMRGRLAKLDNKSSWPCGAAPFGYGKSVYREDATVHCEWHPVSRTLGDVWRPDTTGEMAKSAGELAIRVPRLKGAKCFIRLVPHREPGVVETVRTAFDLFVRLNLSFREIAKRLNQAGKSHYGQPFTHSLIREILSNPAYAGEVHYGKTRTARYYSCDSKGNVEAITTNRNDQPPLDAVGKRPVAQRFVKTDVHQPLVDKATWEAAQHKLTKRREGQRRHPTRNPDYYLKGLLYCGHCGQPMVGRPEKGPRAVTYVCSSYQRGQANGLGAKCHFYCIRHDEAEQLLQNKLRELNLDLSTLASPKNQQLLRDKLAQIEAGEGKAVEEWLTLLRDGCQALFDFVGLPATEGPRRKDKKQHALYYQRRVLARAYEIAVDPRSPTTIELKKPKKYLEDCFARMKEKWPEILTGAGIRDFAHALQVSERDAAEANGTRLAELKATHEKIVLSWATASDMDKEVLKKAKDQLEAQITELTPCTQTASERMAAFHARAAEYAKELNKLQTELPNLEKLERGEAYKRLLERVTLYWDAEHHPPGAARKSRPRKTERQGRNRYHLRKASIEYTVRQTPDMVGTW